MDVNATSFVPFHEKNTGPVKQPCSSAVEAMQKIALQASIPNLPTPKGRPEKKSTGDKSYPHRRTATPSEPRLSPRDAIDSTLADAAKMASKERRNGERRTSLAGKAASQVASTPLATPGPATPEKSDSAKVKELKGALAQKEKSALATNRELSEMRDRQARLKRELVGKKGQLEEASKGLVHSEARSRKLETEKGQLQKILNDVNRSRESLQEELSQKCAKDFLDRVTMDDLTAENAVLTRRITGLEDELSHAATAKKSLSRQINTLEFDLQRKDKTIGRLSSELAVSKEQCNTLRSQTASLLEELDRVGLAFGLCDEKYLASGSAIDRGEGPPIVAQGGVFVGF